MRGKVNGLTAATIAILFAACLSSGIAQEQADLTPLDGYIQNTMKDWNVPGVAVGIVQASKPIYLKGFGVRDIQTRQPVTADTLFDIGSCTKAFTAAPIAILADAGKMNWDDKVTQSIPFFHLFDSLSDESVTLRDLLTHRTGLPGADLIWYGNSITRDEIVRRAAYIHPNASFRTLFQYQNVMYITLGVAVGRASGGTWDDFVKQRIFAPLSMTESDTSSIDAQKSQDYASPHAVRDGKLQVLSWRNIDNAGPAGSINSSVRDMAKWITLQLNDGVFEGKRLISSKNLQEMQRPQIVVPPGEVQDEFFPASTQLSYGFGWFVQDYRGHQLILHPGDIDGFEALTVLIPEIHTGYEILVNKGGDSYRQTLGYHVADLLLHLPEQDWSAHFKANDTEAEKERKAQRASWQAKRNPNTHPSHELNAYVGDYHDPLYGDASVALDGGHLTLSFHGSSAALEHFQYDTFLTKLSGSGDSTRLTFSQDANGDISACDFSGARFQRQKLSASKPLTP